MILSMCLCLEFRKIKNHNIRVDGLSQYVNFSLGKGNWDFLEFVENRERKT